MIYTVTFNPSLDYIVSVKDFKLGLTNRTSSELMLPGGKGLNVSMVLGNLGIANTALGFVAGFTGEEIVRRIEEMGVKSDLIPIDKGISRINLKLKSIDGTEINGCGPEISEDSLQKLMDRLDDLKAGDVLILAGSIPGSMPDDIYRKIMQRLDGRDVMIAVDATKDLLVNVLEYHPFLVKPNNYELGEIFGVDLKTREEVVPYAKKMREMGAVNVLVSMAGEGAVLAAADGSIHAAPAPKGTLVNGVGAGDSMVAGFIAGWMEKNDYKHAFAMGVAAGSASAFSDLLATREEVEAVYEQMTGRVIHMQIQPLQIAGLTCSLFLPSDYDKSTERYPVIYVNGEIPISDVLTELVNSNVRTDFLLLSIKPENWNDDFTPWRAPAFRKGETAPQGKADIYLAKLAGEIKPYIDNHYRTKPEPEHTALFGYSLGGLTAVYALYRTDIFGAVGSLSGSLWYDDFCAFMEREQLLRGDVKVYLSLGKKESLSRNPRMGKVAECTGRAREILTRQIDIRDRQNSISDERSDIVNGQFDLEDHQIDLKGTTSVYFEWNDGGHFHAIEKRFAKAIAWWMK